MASVPNLISLARLLLVPILPALAWNGRQRLFLLVLVLSLLTDAADGYLARKLKRTSELGAKLDSWADLATWLALPICAWWLRRDALRPEAAWLGAGIGCYLASIAFGFLKYHRLISYHTCGAKALAVLATAAVLVFFAGGPGWVLRALMPIVVLSAIEEMLMTARLPEWRANVPSLWHAVKLHQRIRERRALPARTAPSCAGGSADSFNFNSADSK